MAHHHGIIAAGDPQTVRAGAEMLRRGGNAVDAAVAAAFASFVGEMMLVNICGGGIATLRLAETGENIAYDFFADMPGKPFDPHQADFKEIVIDFGDARQSFYIGRASVAVPGVVAGLCHLAATHGTFPLTVLLEPAIVLAEGGAKISPAQAYVAELLHQIFTDTPAAAAILAPSGQPARPGDTIHPPHLADTMRKIAAHGADYFYRGELARKIAADQRRYGGLVTAADLERYRVRRVSPLEVPYRGYTILLPPPASVGGVLIAFSLKLLNRFDLPALPPGDVRRYRILAEAFRLTNLARRSLRLDAAGVAAFLSAAHVDKIAAMLADILAEKTTAPADSALPLGSRDTTHISVMDGAGNVACITTSAGESAGFFIPETGVLMNNILGEIDLHPGGFHSAAPGSRLQTMMSPAIVLRDGEPVLAMGSGGSTRIRSAIVQVLSNVLDAGYSLADAVAFPRLHFEADTLQLEGGTSPDIARALSALGYRVNLWRGKNMYFGGVHSVGLLDGAWQAVGDARRGGVSAVVDSV